jgi:hypothetical protein
MTHVRHPEIAFWAGLSIGLMNAVLEAPKMLFEDGLSDVLPACFLRPKYPWASIRAGSCKRDIEKV